MKILTAQTSDWQSLEVESNGAEALERHLTNILLAERLIVLTGLGTSRCIRGTGNEDLAPTMGDLWDRAKLEAGQVFSDALSAVEWQDDWAQDIEVLLSRCQMANALDPGKSLETFIEGTEKVIAAACDFITPDVDIGMHETFLRRVARRSTRLPRTQIFTTNYDLAFEAAASRTGFAVIDGFSHAHPQSFDGTYFEHDFAVRDRERTAAAVEWVPNVVQLHKLHGSIDWHTTESGQVRRGQPQERPLIVYPRSTKFEVSYQQPFLELMGRYQAALRRPETGLIVVGSGFRDDHITEPVMAAIRSNVRMTCMIVAPGMDNTDNPQIGRVAAMIRDGDRRLALVSATFEEVVPRIPDLVAPTDAERHAHRIAAADGA